MQKLHPVYADQPDECRWLLDQSLWASTIPTALGLKTCFDLLATESAVDAYHYYRDGLNLIANGDQRRWILKDPSHMLGIDSLLEVFPDACIVQTHRDPVDSFRSMASLGYEIRKMLEPNIDSQEVADWMIYAWSEQIKKFENVRKKVGRHRFFDLHMDTLKSDPVQSMERIYDYFEFAVSEQTIEAWEGVNRKDRGMAHAPHTPPESGLTRARVNEAVGDYFDRYQEIEENARSA